MSEIQGSSIEERYPKDLTISQHDLESVNLDEILKKASRDEITLLSFALSDAAKDEKEKGNVSTAKALWLLADIASMTMTPKDEDNPFKPFMQMVNGTRSTTIEDFTDEDFVFFRDVVESIEDYRVRARVADVLWYTGKPTKDFEMAKLAIESYMEYPLDEDSMLRGGFESWMRAIVLAKSIGKPGDKYIEDIRDTLLEKFWEVKDGTSYIAYRLSDLLIEIMNDKELCSRIAESREEIARELFEKKEWMRSRDAFEDAIRWYQKTDCPSKKIYELRDFIATTWVEEAKQHLKNDNGIGASTFIQKAIDNFRTIPTSLRHELGTNEKIRDCRKMLTESNKKAIDQLHVIETGSYDITPLIENAKRHVQNRQWPIVLGYFSHVCRSISKEELKKSAESTMRKSTFRMLASSTRFSTDGRVIDRSPSLNPVDPNDPGRISVLEDEMHMHFSIWIGLCVQGSILPALEVLKSEHDITEEKLYELCERSIIVPVGRERFWAKGLYFGFQEDFMTAIHLLSPQLEHFVRMALKDNGAFTTTIDSRGIETENGLSTLLNMKEAEEIFEEDFLNEMKMLMSSSKGPNLRNVISHGLMEEEEANSDYAIYFWWRMLRMMMDGIMIERKMNEIRK